MAMLIKNVKNDYVRFRYFSNSDKWDKLTEKEKIELARLAFLWVVRNYDSYKFQKEKMLDDIVYVCPEVKGHLFPEDIWNEFKTFFRIFTERGGIVSPEELKWAKKHIAHETYLKQIEKKIYQSLLCGSSHWDKIRHEHKWSLSDEEKSDIARVTVVGGGLGNKRAMEIANEFHFPELERNFVREYFKKLLWDRHLDKAEKIASENEDALISDIKEAIVLNIITKNIDALYLRDALEIAERMLPHKQQIAVEIKSIQQSFKNAN